MFHSVKDSSRETARGRLRTPSPHISDASGMSAPPLAHPPAGLMRSILIPLIGIATLLFSDLCADGARAELRTDGTLRIEWEVKNRFRLFRHEADFQRHVAAAHGDGVLAAGRRVGRATDGRGWGGGGGDRRGVV